MNTEEIYQRAYGISQPVLELARRAEEKAAPHFARTERVAEVNSLKVLQAFYHHRVSEAHLQGSTGYGYDDLGRDTLDQIYAEVFGAEDAIVRHSFVNGTHAIATCLFGILRPGDVMVAATGKPYDTLEEVIGIRGQKNGSLKEFGVSYRQVDLTPDGAVDFDTLGEAVKAGAKLVALQRSKGYAWRKSFSVAELGEVIAFVKQIDPNVICLVDNCYGEFVEETEPCAVGADLIVGSLIKNPGGGLARSGGYIAGRADCVEQVAYRMTCPGIGRECGATLGENRFLYQGFFLAPHVVAQSVKAAQFLSALLEGMGYAVLPRTDAPRTDIIQAVELGDAEKLVAFCQGVQAGAPVDSFVTPAPWDMPGYEDQVVMAAGAFTQGSSIEISADGPIRPPYIAFFQGGLTYETAKVAILLAAQNILNKG